MRAEQPDELDEMIAERSRRDPAFADMVEEAVRRRELVRELTAARRAQGLSQRAVAARMGTSRSVVARIEQWDRDVRLSMLSRYATAIGRSISWSITEGRAV